MTRFRVMEEFWLFAEWIPEWLMMCEGVCSGNLLLLQIGLRGYLDRKMKIYLLFRWKKIIRGSGFLTFWRRRGRVCQIICLRCCCYWRLAWGFLLLASCHFGIGQLTFFPSGHICQSWSVMADIGSIGWQSVVDRLAVFADYWKISAIVLFRGLLDANE